MFFDLPESKAVTRALESPLLAEAILDHAGWLIRVFDLSGRIVPFNHTGELLTGYRAEKVRERSTIDLFITLPWTSSTSS